MSDVDTKCSEVTKPTPRAEATILLIVVALIGTLAVALWGLLVLTYFGKADAKTSGQIFWLGAAAIGGLIVAVLAFLSPLIGTIKLKAGPGGIDAEVDGKAQP